MSIGGSIFLIVVGAILAFAVRADMVGWLDVNIVGWVLMLAGAATLALTLTIWSKKRRARTVTQQRTYEAGEPTVVTEEEVYRDRGAPPTSG